jgi:SWI/SNF-related matrix-associated actin-dependent regulator of chromatin subfamily D
MEPLQPVKLQYTIRVDKEFHENPQPTVYDLTVHIDDPIRDAFASYLTNPTYATNLREIAQLNDNLSVLVQKISQSKSKHAFFEQLARHPTDFITKWLSSQKRDLEIIAGDATRGGGEDASGDEWRRGGRTGIWGSENVRESVNLMVSTKSRTA